MQYSRLALCCDLAGLRDDLVTPTLTLDANPDGDERDEGERKHRLSHSPKRQPKTQPKHQPKLSCPPPQQPTPTLSHTPQQEFRKRSRENHPTTGKHTKRARQTRGTTNTLPGKNICTKQKAARTEQSKAHTQNTLPLNDLPEAATKHITA